MVMMDFYLLPHAMQCNLNGNERLAASLALAFEPSGVMDSLKAVTSGQDQDQQIDLAYMGQRPYLILAPFYLSASQLVERQLFLPGCMDILLQLHWALGAFLNSLFSLLFKAGRQQTHKVISTTLSLIEVEADLSNLVLQVSNVVE